MDDINMNSWKVTMPLTEHEYGPGNYHKLSLTACVLWSGMCGKNDTTCILQWLQDQTLTVMNHQRLKQEQRPGATAPDAWADRLLQIRGTTGNRESASTLL